MIYQHRRNSSAGVAPSSLLEGEIAANTSDCVLYVGTGTSVVSVKPRLSATDRLLGRSSAGAGPAEEITCTAAGRAILDDADAAAQRVTLGAAPSAGPVFTGVAEFAVGSSSAPSLCFTGDTDSGIYRSAADAISITCGTYEIFTASLSGLSVRHYLASTPTSTAVSDLNRPVFTVLQRAASGYHTYLHGYQSGQSTGVFLSGANADLASLSCGMSMQTASGLFPTGSVTYRSYRSDACSIELNDGNVVIRSTTTGTADNATITYTGAGNVALAVTAGRNVLIGGNATPTSGVANLVLFNGTAPTASVTDGVVLFAADVSASSELRVRDEAGNVTTLSPHRFDLIPGGPSEPMAWAYYSERDGHRINVDMLRLARLIERLTGEKLVYEEAPL